MICLFFQDNIFYCFFSSNKAAVGIEINQTSSRYWVEYQCEPIIQIKGNMSLILINCTLPGKKFEFAVPEEASIRCLKTIKDPKNRTVRQLL